MCSPAAADVKCCAAAVKCPTENVFKPLRLKKEMIEENETINSVQRERCRKQLREAGSQTNEEAGYDSN